MAVKTRARAILIPIVFYLVLGSASAWLVWGASQGDRGLKAKAQYDAEAAQLRVQLTQLQTDHERWRRRVESMRSEAVDSDLLDEEARAKLDRVGKDDVVICAPVTKANGGRLGAKAGVRRPRALGGAGTLTTNRVGDRVVAKP